MLAQNTIDSSRRVVKSLLFIVSMVLVLAVPAFAQPMSFNSTVYTDCGDQNGYLHCWGYTYAPSGSSIIHTYKAHTRMTFPDGFITENWGSGSGSAPATANLIVQVTLDTPDGNFFIDSDHQARCPLGGLFLSTASSLAAIGKTSEVWYGSFQGSDINWTIPIKNCFYLKCGLPYDDICWPSRSSGGLTQTSIDVACPAGYRDKFKKIILCWHVEHVEYPTWDPCSGLPPPSFPPWI